MSDNEIKQLLIESHPLAVKLYLENLRLAESVKQTEIDYKQLKLAYMAIHDMLVSMIEAKKEELGL